MGKVVWLSLVFALAASAVLPTAQADDDALVCMGWGPRGTVEERLERRVRMLSYRLALSDDQAAKVKAVFDANLPDLKAARKSNVGDPAARRAAVHAVMKRMDDQVAAVLNDKQKAEFEWMRKLRPYHRGRGRARPGGCWGPGPGPGPGYGPPPAR